MAVFNCSCGHRDCNRTLSVEGDTLRVLDGDELVVENTHGDYEVTVTWADGCRIGIGSDGDGVVTHLDLSSADFLALGEVLGD